jgi:PAS domain S-box-containing protein
MAPADHGRAGPDDAPDVTARALAALDELPEGAVLLRPVRDATGTVVDLVFAYVNQWAGHAGGVPASQLMGQRVLEGLQALPRDLFDSFVAVLDGGPPLRTTVDYSDAFAGHAEFSGRFQITASCLDGALLVVYDDVAARARARSAEQRYGAVLEATSDWVSIADRDQRLLYVNAGGRRMVGIGLDEDIRGTRIGEFSPAWAREFVRGTALAVALRDGVWRGNLARLHRDGHEIPVSQVIVARTGPDGEVDFYATIARDMSGERAAEAALRGSEERFRIAFEQAPIGVSLVDLDGRFVQVNDAYCRTIRRTREDLMRLGPEEITHPDDLAVTSHAMRRLIAGDMADFRVEKRYVAPDGETIWAELSLAVLHDDEDRPQFIIGMLQSIGERRVAQTLQRSMLTTVLPRIDGVQLAVRYLPGSPESEVGGDWYDVIPLPDGRVGVVIGDVVGRGIEAAVTMSQLRTALRAYAIDGLEPAEVVRKLHRLTDHLAEGLSTTLVYLDLDPATGELRYVSAGHLPVLHVDVDGVPSFLDGARSTPLGTLSADVAIPQVRLVLEPGECVLLYTDGLVERRDDGIVRRLEQLRLALANAPEELEACLDHVTATMTGDALRFDDIALLKLRYAPSTAPPS